MKDLKSQYIKHLKSKLRRLEKKLAITSKSITNIKIGAFSEKWSWFFAHAPMSGGIRNIFGVWPRRGRYAPTKNGMS